MQRTRRQILLYALIILNMFVYFFIIGCDDLKILYRKLKGKFKKNEPSLPIEDRVAVHLPEIGYTVSVEKALNSRCTSDFDGDQTVLHWGLLDDQKKLENQVIEEVMQQAENIPVLVRARTKIAKANNILTFIVDNYVQGSERQLLMVQSGMQQQALSLICAARGIGIAFKGLGRDGRELSEKEYGAVRMRLEPMKTSYGDSLWTDKPPIREQKWRNGNLPAPNRDGDVALMTAINKATLVNDSGKLINSIKQISQLLWASRGRTPHLYLSKPWGLTIPTYRGNQNLTNVKIHDAFSTFEYVNWKDGHPTHELKKISDNVNTSTSSFPYNCFITLNSEKSSACALWEIGCQLFNIVVQSVAINIKFRVFSDTTDLLKQHSISINAPTVAVGLQLEGSNGLWNIKKEI